MAQPADDGRTLPVALLEKLAAKGYVDVDDQALDLGAEKFVYGAYQAMPRTGVVLLYSKTGPLGRRAWKYQRELEVFEDLTGHEHPNIIRMLDFFGPDRSHGPAMILERVDPLGFDMFKVVKQYQGSHRRTLPVAQLLHYLGQLIEAVDHLHQRGWVHCDLKPDNVMIQMGHEIKVIDFGFAKRAGTEPGPGKVAVYMPPEFAHRSQPVQTSADLWLIGAMMFVVFAQMQVTIKFENGRNFEVPAHAEARQNGVTAAIHKWWGKKIDPSVGVAIDNLLQMDPAKRWTLPRLREWWQHTKGNLTMGPDMLPIPADQRNESAHRRFHKAPPLDRLVKAFGLEVTAGSELVGKFIGPHTVHETGERIDGSDKVIDLRRMAGATVLFIDRGPNVGVVTLPRASDQVRQGDWIYYLLQDFQTDEITDEQREFQLKAEEARRVGVEIWLEFDWFEFPQHCVGASFLETSLGRLFGLNVHFIDRQGVPEEVPESGALPSEMPATTTLIFQASRDTIIMNGDRALVCRVPDRETGRSTSTLTDELLEPLLNEAEFRTRLSLTDNKVWQDWRDRCALKCGDQAGVRSSSSVIFANGVADDGGFAGSQRRSSRACTDPGGTAAHAAQAGASTLADRATTDGGGEV